MVVVVMVLAPADSSKQYVALNDQFEGLTILLGIESSGLKSPPDNQIYGLVFFVSK
jgi:hypothetical protein